MMNLKFNLFMLAPVAVSLLALAVLFRPALATDIASTHVSQQLLCPLNSLQIVIIPGNGVAMLSCARENSASANVVGNSKCPYAAGHADWLEQHHQRYQTRPLQMVDSYHPESAPKLTASSFVVNGRLQQSVLAIDVPQNPIYAF